MEQVWLDQDSFLNFINNEYSLKRSKQWASLHRSNGSGPKFAKIGQAVRYRQDWIVEWAESKVRGGN